MSDNENSNVELTDSGQYNKYRPMELQESLENSLRRSKAPAVPNIAMELKKSKQDIKEDKEHPSDADDVLDTEKKHSNTKKLASKNELRDELATKTTPIPNTLSSNILIHVPSAHPIKPIDLKESEIKSKEESFEGPDNVVTEPEPEVEEPSVWSEEGEASGMPRTESHASRVSRAVRQFFCCGTLVEAASEDNISYIRDSGL